MGFATKYCETVLNDLSAGETSGQTLTFTASKTGELETTFILTSETSTLTGLYEAVFQISGGGVTSTDWADWDVSAGTLTKVVTWTTYPSSAIQLHLVAFRDNSGGGSNIIGKTITDIDVSTACGGSGGGGPTPTPGEKFVAEDASISSTYFATGDGWTADTESGAEYNSTTGVISVSLVPARNLQWQAQVKLALGFSYAADKYYDFSIKFHANQAVGGVTLKTSNDNALFFEDQSVNLPADADFVFTKSDVAGVAGDNTFVFDFGHAPANTNITISDISIIEKDAPAVEPSAFSIKEVWPTERVTASMNGDDVDVHIASYGDGQWQGQLKLQHQVDFENTKSYKFAFTMTADKDCGGITLKVDDNTGSVWENQSINLTANTPLNYEKVFAGQAENNKITVFDFGWVGENTNIAISNLSLIEYSPAIASSTNGANIPFKAVDGNADSRWQAASKGEAWWRMDYGTAQSFNRVNITWETSYAKSFTIQGSNDDETYTTIKTITSQTLDAPNKYKQIIDLDQTYNYRYVKFVGTENANDYGFSFYEFEIMEVETSVLTDVVISSPKRKTVCAVGQSIDITAVARDQYEEPMAGQTITYSVSPAAKGSIDANGHYTASVVGEVTITATCSDKSAIAVVENTISANLALNKPATAGHNETPIANANDNNLASLWALGPNQAVDDMWWRVDLEDTYDLSLVIIKWEGACPTEHAIQVSADEANWTDAATKSGWPEIGTDQDHNYQFYPINETGRYIRVKASALRENGWGMKIFDFQAFGTLASTPTKSVSATPNDALMGSATVKQGGVAVVDVTTGTEVEFSAEANDGYVFVNWSNGETRATFTTTVETNMDLTANFRAIRTVYCNAEMENNGHTIYVTMKRSNTNEYKLVVRSTEELSNFGGTVLYKPVNEVVQDLRNQGVLSDGNHVLTGTVTADKEPYFGTPLYVVFAGIGEVTYPKLTDIEYSVACEDAEVESIALDVPSATVEVGATRTLIPSFTPAYAIDKTVTWTTSDASIASVTSSGVVRGESTGNATITATCNGKTATCAITVVAATAKTLYGASIESVAGGSVGINYSITRSLDGKLHYAISWSDDLPALGDVSINDGDWHSMTKNGRSAEWTSTDTYSSGDVINCFFHLPYQGGVIRIDVAYTAGSDNEAEKPNTYVTLNDEATDNLTRISNNENVEVDVIFTRTFPLPEEWYTLCLPFDMNEAQLTASLGAGYTLATLTSSEDRGTILHLNFNYVRSLVAGIPYMFKPGAGVTERPIFEGVTIPSGIATIEVGDAMMKFKGTFTQITLDSEKQRFVGPENYLYSPAEGGTAMDAFRCYFTIPDGSPYAGMPGKRARIVFGEQTATGIGDVQSDNVQSTKVLRDGQLLIIRDGRTYNAQGMLVK